MFRIKTDHRGGPSVNHLLGWEVTAEELEYLQAKGLVTIRYNRSCYNRPDVLTRGISEELGREVPEDYKYLS